MTFYSYDKRIHHMQPIQLVELPPGAAELMANIDDIRRRVLEYFGWIKQAPPVVPHKTQQEINVTDENQQAPDTVREQLAENGPAELDYKKYAEECESKMRKNSRDDLARFLFPTVIASFTQTAVHVEARMQQMNTPEGIQREVRERIRKVNAVTAYLYADSLIEVADIPPADFQKIVKQTTDRLNVLINRDYRVVEFEAPPPACGGN